MILKEQVNKNMSTQQTIFLLYRVHFPAYMYMYMYKLLPEDTLQMTLTTTRSHTAVGNRDGSLCLEKKKEKI